MKLYLFIFYVSLFFCILLRLIRGISCHCKMVCDFFHVSIYMLITIIQAVCTLHNQIPTLTESSINTFLVDLNLNGPRVNYFILKSG